MANNLEKLENMDEERGGEKPPLEFKEIKEIKERQPKGSLHEKNNTEIVWFFTKGGVPPPLPPLAKFGTISGVF